MGAFYRNVFIYAAFRSDDRFNNVPRITKEMIIYVILIVWIHDILIQGEHNMDNLNDNLAFMKSGFDLPEREFISDQERGMPPPCAAKTIDDKLKIIELPTVDKKLLSTMIYKLALIIESS
jgi:hypothetical protein